MIPIRCGSSICDASSIIANANCLREKISEWEVSDVVVPVITLAQTIVSLMAFALLHLLTLFSSIYSL